MCLLLGGRQVPVIEIVNLTKFFGKVPAVVEANLCVEAGDFFGFVGPNGSGKSTTIRILMNYLKATSGSAEIFGMDVARDSVRIKQQTGYVPSELDFYPDCKAGELIRYAADLHHIKDAKRIRQLCELFEVEEERRMCKMSLGNRKKVALVTALLHSPQLLILDEATAGLDSLVKKRLKDLLKKENEKGVTIFFCSHDMAEVQELCSKTAVIRNGSILEVAQTGALSAGDTHRVLVKTQEDLSALFSLFHISDAVFAGGYWQFCYKEEVDILIKALANYHIEDIQIGLPSLEDTIIRFYEKKIEKENVQLEQSF